MVFMWILSDLKTGEKECYLQFFPQDKRYPIDKAMATEILSGYEYGQVTMPETEMGEDAIDSTHKMVVYEIRGDPPLLIHEMLSPGEFTYKMRFSFSGEDVAVSSDFLYIFQSACNLEPIDPEGHKYGRGKRQYFKIQPKKMPYIRLE
ncbi:MAG: hypothetical protein LUP94_02840 [Candidatus Methanomethylicus sp.]|nr:hypothetical protein [Candidatus Methanomethylicus sp.]